MLPCPGQVTALLPTVAPGLTQLHLHVGFLSSLHKWCALLSSLLQVADASASHVLLARASHSPRLPPEGWKANLESGWGAGDNGEQGQGSTLIP